MFEQILLLRHFFLLCVEFPFAVFYNLRSDTSWTSATYRSRAPINSRISRSCSSRSCCFATSSCFASSSRSRFFTTSDRIRRGLRQRTGRARPLILGYRGHVRADPAASPLLLALRRVPVRGFLQA